MLLGLILKGIVVAAALSAIVIVVNGIITKEKIRKQLKEKGVEDAIVDKIDNCSNTVTLKDLESENTYEIRGDDIDSDIDEGDVIYCY